MNLSTAIGVGISEIFGYMGAGGSGGTGRLLLEEGAPDYVLLESADYILLE